MADNRVESVDDSADASQQQIINEQEKQPKKHSSLEKHHSGGHHHSHEELKTEKQGRSRADSELAKQQYSQFTTSLLLQVARGVDGKQISPIVGPQSDPSFVQSIPPAPEAPAVTATASTASPHTSKGVKLERTYSRHSGKKSLVVGMAAKIASLPHHLKPHRSKCSCFYWNNNHLV